MNIDNIHILYQIFFVSFNVFDPNNAPGACDIQYMG